MSTATITPSKTFTTAAINAEIGRRAKNKARKAKGQPKARAASWVLPGMSGSQLKAVLAGDTVEVQFKSGRIEHVALA